MPRLNPKQVAEAEAQAKPSRSPKQLANDARLRAGKPKAAITSDDFSGRKTEVDISATGPLEIKRSSIEVIPEAKGAAKAAEAAFMNQMVTVEIESTEDPDEPVWIPSGNGGTMQYIRRGVPQPIRLLFLYSLIAAKKTALTSNFGKDGTGKEFNHLVGRSSTTHRFQVIEASPEARKKIAEWSQLPA